MTWPNVQDTMAYSALTELLPSPFHSQVYDSRGAKRPYTADDQSLSEVHQASYGKLALRPSDHMIHDLFLYFSI